MTRRVRLGTPSLGMQRYFTYPEWCSVRARECVSVPGAWYISRNPRG